MSSNPPGRSAPPARRETYDTRARGKSPAPVASAWSGRAVDRHVKGARVVPWPREWRVACRTPGGSFDPDRLKQDVSSSATSNRDHRSLYGAIVRRGITNAPEIAVQVLIVRARTRRA